MTYTIKITPEARVDIQDARDYYKLKSKKLAKEFLHNVDLAFEPLKTNPFLFQRGYKGIRKSPIAKFKSSIHYFTEEKTVVVIAVLHNSRSPQIWKKRTK